MSEFDATGAKYSVSENAVIDTLVVKSGPTALPYLPDGVLSTVGGVVTSTADPSGLANVSNVIFQPFNGGAAIQGNIYNTWSDIVTLAQQLNINGTLTIWFDWLNAAGNPILIGGISGPRIIFKSNWSIPASEGPVLPVVLFDPGLNGTPTQFLIDLFEVDGLFTLKIRGNKTVQTTLWSSDFIAGFSVKNGASVLFDYSDPAVVPISFAGSVFIINIYNCAQTSYGNLASMGGVSKNSNSQVQPFLMAPNQELNINISGGGIAGNDPTVGPNYGLATCSVPGAGGANLLVVNYDASSYFQQNNVLTATDSTFNAVSLTPTSITDNIQQVISNPTSFVPIFGNGNPQVIRDVIDWLSTPIGIQYFQVGEDAAFVSPGSGITVPSYTLNYQAGFIETVPAAGKCDITIPSAMRGNGINVAVNWRIPFRGSVDFLSGDVVNAICRLNGVAIYGSSEWQRGPVGGAYDPTLHQWVTGGWNQFFAGAGGDIQIEIFIANSCYVSSANLLIGMTNCAGNFSVYMFK